MFSLDDEAHYRLTKLTNDVTYRKIKNALHRLNNYRSGPALHLIDVAFGVVSPSPPLQLANQCDDDVSNAASQSDVNLFNPNLDDSQKEAVEFAIARPDVAIVHGPPGSRLDMKGRDLSSTDRPIEIPVWSVEIHEYVFKLQMLSDLSRDRYA